MHGPTALREPPFLDALEDLLAPFAVYAHFFGEGSVPQLRAFDAGLPKANARLRVALRRSKAATLRAADARGALSREPDGSGAA